VIAPAQGTPVTQYNQGDAAEFVSDVTVPDGTSFGPKESFTKTWRLRNVGTTTWTTDYEVAFVRGDQMQGQNTNLNTQVEPGEIADISIQFTSPPQVGHFVSYWMLKTPDGKTFGIAPSASGAFYVDINVGDASENTQTEETTTTPEATTVTNSGGIFSNVTISVDNDEYIGTCPHAFKFTAQFTLSKKATVSYSFDGGTEQGYIKLSNQLPQPVSNVDLKPGTHTIGPFLIQYDDARKIGDQAWIQLHIVEPEEVLSNQLYFILRCE
jgi:hypothetical protein